MPVKIRLTRVGKKKQPTYRVVVVDSRKPRDGAHIEQIGRYDPRQDPSVVHIDNDRALTWLQRGAQPTERARKLLEISGAWARFRVARGEIHTIEEDPPPLPPVAAVPESAVAEEPSEAQDEVEASGEVETSESDSPVVEVEAGGENDTSESDAPVVEAVDESIAENEREDEAVAEADVSEEPS